MPLHVPNLLEKISTININNNAHIPNIDIEKIVLPYAKTCDICHININILQNNKTVLMTQISNTTFSYLPVISHLAHFSKYIKQDLRQNLNFKCLDCEHATQLVDSIICK